MELIRLLLILILGILFQSQVQADLKEYYGSNDSSILTTNIISHNQRSQFREAGEKLIRFNVSLPNVEIVVGTVFDNPLKSIDLMIRYKDSSIVKIIYSILTAMWQKMKLTDHMDLLSLSVLYDTFTNSVINKEQASDEMRTEAKITCNEVHSEIVMVAAKRLKEAVVNRNYRNNTNVEVMNNMLQDLNNSIIDDTYRKLIHDVYNEVATVDLIRDMCSNQNANQVVTAVVAIFKKILQSRDVSGESIKLMAGCLNRLRDMSTFMKLPQEKKNYVTYVVSRLPDSVRNLYFAEKVCIRNAYYSQYLYSPAKDFGYTVDGAGKMRYVFALYNESFNEHLRWIAKKDNDNDFVFTFMSDAYRNEFMFVSESTSYIMGYSDVATWIPGGTKGNQSLWEVRLAGENIYLLNLHFNTLLCIDGVKHPPTQRRLVFAKDHSPFAEKCEWIIESCEGIN